MAAVAPISKPGKSSSVSGSRLAIRLSGGVIAAAALAAYHNSFHIPFVFDDAGTIAENQSIRHLWPIWSALTPPPGGTPVSGRPIANFSLALNYALGGTNVWGYHAVNLLIHILAGLALFGIVRRTLERWSELPPTRSMGGADQRVGGNPLHLNILPAFAIALIWTLHPLQTESVTYISQRAESLMGLFYLLTLYCFIRSLDCVEVGRRVPVTPSSPPELRTVGVAGTRRPTSILFAGLSFLACALGMATKEVMVTAPVIAFLYDRTFVSGTFRQAWQTRRRYYLGLGSTWLLLAGLVAGTGSRGQTAGFGTSVSWTSYGITQFRAVAHYLRLSLWPHPLVFFYGSAVGTPPGQLAVDMIVVMGLLAATIWALTAKIRIPKFEFRNLLGFSGAWFFLILAPSSSVVPIATETIAEHRMYLSLAAVVAIAVCGGYAIIISNFEFRISKFLSLAILGLVAVACGVLTARRNEDYRSEMTLWRDTVDKMPGNSDARNNVGYALLQQGDVAGAIEQCREAVRLDPANAKAYANLADALVQAGQLREAMTDYEASLNLIPNDAETQNNLALLLARMGRLPEAITHYQEAIRLKPYLPEIHNNLGIALVGTGRLEEGIAEYGRALSLRPDYAEADYNLGNALAAAGRLPEAMEDFEKSLKLRPDFPDAHNSLGNVLAQLGQMDQAVEQFSAASRLLPDNPVLHNNLGCALAQLGRTAEARIQFEKALRLKPDDPEVRANLARLPKY